MAGASGTADPAALEQHFVLRVPNPELADKLRGWLRNTEQLNEHISLIFEARKRHHASSSAVDDVVGLHAAACC